MELKPPTMGLIQSAISELFHHQCGKFRSESSRATLLPRDPVDHDVSITKHDHFRAERPLHDLKDLHVRDGIRNWLLTAA